MLCVIHVCESPEVKWVYLLHTEIMNEKCEKEGGILLYLWV